MTTEQATGDASRLYQAVLAHLQSGLWNDIRNARTVSWMVSGLLLSQRSTFPHWLSHINAGATLAQSTERRVRRWLKNPAIDLTSIYGPLITRALRDWGEHTLILALDTSVLFEKFCLIRISVLFRGRAVPLVSRVLEHSSAQVSTAQLLPILAEVKGMLDFLKLREVRLLADRGFCDTALMGWLRVCGWHYRIRIKSSLIMAAPGKKRLCKVGEVKLAPRETRCLHNITLTGQHFGPVHIALGRPTDGPEQWQVVSDQPTGIETFAEYGERFQIEEGFLDEKSGLFGLEDSRLRDAASLERLVLVLAIATLLLVSEGLQTVQSGDQRVVDPHWKRALSYLKIGLRTVQYALSRGRTVFSRLTLQGGPDPEPPSRRKRSDADPRTTLEVGWQLVFRPLS
ncbi:IS4/IS5 family transposase (plasmid) [Deinococcus psychrotolerans]|uniref:IS4/IS5 family transposase n=1 Tax=Deinococcus psychrotolerans TaxID=2489213 RepID=A0A3G8YJ00_9DEIO|nr:IS4/IS5 family transposase [Deinococcus psychrotolerans]